MCMREECSLDPHVLPENALLLETERPINDVETLRICGSYTSSTLTHFVVEFRYFDFGNFHIKEKLLKGMN